MNRLIYSAQRVRLATLVLITVMPMASATSLNLQLRLDEQLAETVSLRVQPSAVIAPPRLDVNSSDHWRALGAPSPVVLQLSHWRLNQTPAFGVSASVALPLRR